MNVQFCLSGNDKRPSVEALKQGGDEYRMVELIESNASYISLSGIVTVTIKLVSPSNFHKLKYLVS